MVDSSNSQNEGELVHRFVLGITSGCRKRGVMSMIAAGEITFLFIPENMRKNAE
jgi:hypothetical protein